MRSNQAGQATIEFAMFMLFMVILVTTLGTLTPRIAQQIMLTNAAQAGARTAADAADRVETALSCGAPANYQCIQNSERIMTDMVDAGLPCEPSAPGYSGATCINAVHALANASNNYGLALCSPFPPVPGPYASQCNLFGLLSLTPLIAAGQTCATAPPAAPPTCKEIAEKFTQGAIEVGIGCDQISNYICPPPLNNVSPSTTPPQCRLNGQCTKNVAEQIIAGVAQTALTCAAIRSSLALNTWDTCYASSGDDPYIDLTPDTFIPNTCLPAGAYPAGDLFASCVARTIRFNVTVHWQKYGLVASASAIPTTQYLP